eukprot:5563-Amphidinium_carterae.1
MKQRNASNKALHYTLLETVVVPVFWSSESHNQAFKQHNKRTTTIDEYRGEESGRSQKSSFQEIAKNYFS